MSQPTSCGGRAVIGARTSLPVSIVIIAKCEAGLREAVNVLRERTDPRHEIVVVEADGRDFNATANADAEGDVRWIRYTAPPGVRISIPHQRNAGVRAASRDAVVFLDAGCDPADDWLDELVAPIERGAEEICSSTILSPGGTIYTGREPVPGPDYRPEAPTLGLAVTTGVLEAVGGFDESFAYGSDVDLCWRAVARGFRILAVPSATVVHEMGSARRQLYRSYQYGVARARLYAKHTDRLRRILVDDPTVVAYPLFILGLPATLRLKAYPLLLAIPLVRNRGGRAVEVTANHLAYGLGVLAEVARAGRRGARRGLPA